MEAVDRTFRDIRNDPRPFGGVVFCFCGDFRQILPVVPKGSRGQIVSACLKRSNTIWPHITVLLLTINMRLLSREMPDDERIQQQEFADRILSVGDGQSWPMTGLKPDGGTERTALFRSGFI